MQAGVIYKYIKSTIAILKYSYEDPRKYGDSENTCKRYGPLTACVDANVQLVVCAWAQSLQHIGRVN